jgi:hypothetical protein
MLPLEACELGALSTLQGCCCYGGCLGSFGWCYKELPSSLPESDRGQLLTGTTFFYKAGLSSTCGLRCYLAEACTDLQSSNPLRTVRHNTCGSVVETSVEHALFSVHGTVTVVQFMGLED